MTISKRTERNYDFPLDLAEKFYKDQRIGFFRIADFVRLTKDGEKPLFKTIIAEQIVLNEHTDPKWLPVPVWAFPDDYGNEPEFPPVDEKVINQREIADEAHVMQGNGDET